MIREALRNLLSRPALSLFMTLSITAIFGGSSVVVLKLTDDAFDRQAALQNSGYLTFRVERSSDFGGHVNSLDCDALSSGEHIVASTWIGAEKEFDLLDFEGPPLRVTPVGNGIDGVLAAIGIHTPPTNMLVGAESQFASSATLNLIGPTFARPETRSTAGTDLRSLGSAFAGGALIRDPTTVGPVDACVGVADIQARASGLATIRSGFPPESGYSAYYVLDLPEQVETPLQKFETHRSRRYPELVALVTTILWLLYLRLRRAEMVFYSLAGLTRRRLFLVFETELAVFMLPAAVLCGAVARRGNDLQFPQDHAMAAMALFLARALTLALVWLSVLLAAQVAYVSGRSTQVLKDS